MGYTRFLEGKKGPLLSVVDYLVYILIAFGGSIAEQIYFQNKLKISNGSGHDSDKIFMILSEMVHTTQLKKTVEVKQIFDELHQLSFEILSHHKNLLNKLKSYIENELHHNNKLEIKFSNFMNQDSNQNKEPQHQLKKDLIYLQNDKLRKSYLKKVEETLSKYICCENKNE